MISKHETIQLSNKKLFEIRRGKEVGSKNYKVGLEKSDSDIAFIRTSDVVNYEIDLCILRQSSADLQLKRKNQILNRLIS